VNRGEGRRINVGSEERGKTNKGQRSGEIGKESQSKKPHQGGRPMYTGWRPRQT